MKKTSVFVLAITVLVACGPSKEEAAAIEKAKMDSVARATEDNIARQKAIQDSVDAFNANQQVLKQQLIDLKAKLEAETAKLNDVEQFKLLRTADEKQQQIEDQTRVIEELKSQISEIEKQIVG